MAKFIKNKSLRIISLGDKDFIPGADPVEVTDAEAAHPMISAYITAKILELTEDATNDTDSTDETETASATTKPSKKSS